MGRQWRRFSKLTSALGPAGVGIGALSLSSPIEFARHFFVGGERGRFAYCGATGKLRERTVRGNRSRAEPKKCVCMATRAPVNQIGAWRWQFVARDQPIAHFFLVRISALLVSALSRSTKCTLFTGNGPSSNARARGYWRMLYYVCEPVKECIGRIGEEGANASVCVCE